MIREFSAIRRRSGVVDVVTPKRPGVEGYALEWAPNFDIPFTPLVISGLAGYCDPSLRYMPHTPIPAGNVRIIFNPSTYGIDDTKAFWLHFIPISGGAPGAASNPGLVLPDQAGRGAIVIAGNAPNAGDITGSLQLDFPRLVEDIRVFNQAGAGGNSIFIATEGSNAEHEIIAGVGQNALTSIRGALACIRVRGDGSDVPFTATFTLAFAR